MAVVVGAFGFLGGLLILFAIPGLEDDDPETRLYELNFVLGSALLYAGLGGFLLVQAASALGGASSSPLRTGWLWYSLPLFPLLVGIGQLIANNPETAPWLFPFVNAAMVAVPSLGVAALVARRYLRAHPFAWPVSWREWTSAIIYGAVGATTLAGIVNTAYLGVLGSLLVDRHGNPNLPDFADRLATLPQGWGIFLDVSTLSVVAPLNEELFKALIVALFFFRRGGAARCFAWGVMAGTGFNLLETFTNSIVVVDPSLQNADQAVDTWWLFAVARAGTAAMHGLAAGLGALTLYGLLRGRPRYLLGYPAAVLLHGTWNFLVYMVEGDALFSQQGPDSLALDIAGSVGLVAVAGFTAVMLWLLSGQLRDEAPAPIYRMLGMLPASEPTTGEAEIEVLREDYAVRPSSAR
ncbi:MAG: PrsW family intramembrane metalloprotease [Dehalococcoidia bacterium]|nr:PrsW family intramembrane metalloprotease [Dehalococcoidia bacterium]